MTVLWFPRGHAAIPSLDFPQWLAPHVEFYKGKRPGLETYLVYAGASGEGLIPPFSTNVSCGLADELGAFGTLEG